MSSEMQSMEAIEQLAELVLHGDQLTARALARDIARKGGFASMPEPDPARGDQVAIMAAALAELLASYAHAEPPPWTRRWGAMRSVLDVLPATTEQLRDLLIKDVPEPLRRRNIRAPRGFLRDV